MTNNKDNSIINDIKAKLKKYNDSHVVSEFGTVVSLGDGIALADGLDNVMLNEIVRFEDGTEGLALNLEEDIVGIVILGEFSGIKEGDKVYRTNRIVQVPVGDCMLGRVVNALGKPIDNKGAISATKFDVVEKIAHGVMDRKSVHQPLETGILSVDAMFPIGKGQRELIIGDRQTGKTTVAIDAIINQRGRNVNCVYVAIGQKNSTVANVVRTLEKTGAMEYTTVVAANASELPALQYLAPFTGVTIAEEWMHEGKDVLIVYDDLSKHAIAYRTLSLLLRRPPGREAYPGDVFYLHSRLLERACKLNDALGAGSITALPIVETQAGDISAYIPTNVISITDGQLFMMTSLFNAGQRPAIDAGQSVSRVGSAAQIKSVKQTGASLKLELANYRELEAFSQFGSDLDEETKRILDLGKSVMAIIKQAPNKPYSQTDEAIILFTVKEKMITQVPVDRIQDFKEFLIDYMKGTNLRADLEKKQAFDKQNTLAFRCAIQRAINVFLHNDVNHTASSEEEKAAFDAFESNSSMMNANVPCNNEHDFEVVEQQEVSECCGKEDCCSETESHSHAQEHKCTHHSCSNANYCGGELEVLKFKKVSHSHDELPEVFNVDDAIVAYASNLNMIENVDAFERAEFNQYLLKNLANTELYNTIAKQESISEQIEPTLIKAIHLEISKFIYRDTEHENFCVQCCKPCHCEETDVTEQEVQQEQEEEKARLAAEEAQRIMIMQEEATRKEQEEALLEAQRLEQERLDAEKAQREAEESEVVEEIQMAQAASDDEVLAREQQVLVKSEKAVEGVEKQTVMISISPEEATELFENGKSAIFFKVTPVLPVERVVVYVTAPVKQVLGEFDLLDIKKGKISRMWDNYKAYSVIATNKAYKKYFADHKDAHALIASRVYKYRNPKELASFDMKRGPSGFTYLK